MFKHELVIGSKPARYAVLFVTGLSIALIAIHLFSSIMDGATTLAQRPGQSKGQSKTRRPKAQQRRLDNSHFSHQTHLVQQKLICESCHKFPSKNWNAVRQGDEAFPDVTEYPEHQACLACHRQQFFAPERPVPRICSHCHVKATPRDTSRYPFPSLGEKFLSSAKAANFSSDFRVFFPHNKHLEVISQSDNRRAADLRFIRASFGSASRIEDSDPKSCSTCHLTHQPQGTSDEFVTKPPADLGDSFWLKKGTFKTRPMTHASCFTCHNQESELAPLPPDCNACHKLASPSGPTDFDSLLAKKIGSDDWYALTAWRSRQSAGTFRHEAHEMSCTKCHNAEAMDTVDVRSLKVQIKSCGGEDGCHVTATADDGGVLNYEMDQRKANERFVCVKCHLVFGAKPAPASHGEAILTAGKK